MTASPSPLNSSSLSSLHYDPTIVGYVLSGILGAFVWDVFSNIGYDYELLWRWPVEVPAATYLISRISTLIFSIVTLVFVVTTDTASCARLVTTEKWSVAVAISTTSLLFFWRVRAVYKDNRIVCGFFFLAWLAVACASVLHTQFSVFVLDLEQIQQAGRCFTTGSYSTFIIASTLVPMVNDLLIFCAITYRLMAMAEVDNPTPKKRLMVALFGKYLPAFSRTLLQDGQAYFLTLVPIYTFSMVCYALYPHTISRYTVVVAFPAIAFANLMACKIYRKTRLGIHTASETDSLVKPSRAMAFVRSATSFT
ncbi:hypothetical protein HYPSUDRAFT_44210 [Hypholoma sublateritium FD-334 SS-4]|uniref:Uncharacterized protein n=1 Tax=Hypholoma sublateritium (strain FD-334 SS-4) TaxID=945553 RepID=A0A0D2NRZ5_HYPSF|nr:hypothetical protein HYPSUDRAFT_44210 [Hypholoma sublateritium FD-334 SS-4]